MLGCGHTLAEFQSALGFGLSKTLVLVRARATTTKGKLHVEEPG